MISLVQLLVVILLASTSFNCEATKYDPVFIRVNQLGFLPGDLKTGVAFSEGPIENINFVIKNIKSGKDIYQGKFIDSVYEYDKFKYCYSFDFSKVKEEGSYVVELGGRRSTPFKIGNDIYNNVVDSLMLFYKVQRCGPTNPILHAPCHLSDVSRVVGDSTISGMVDLTGGWHDAGDYIKFLSTTAYTTYMMMFAYEFDNKKFGFDDNNNGVPDILEEAKVGLDWMLRANYAKYKLVTQVQDLRDHEVGWRLPKNDALRYDRPGYVGIGKNQIGIFSAAMSLASRIWKKEFKADHFSQKCLDAAENLYSIRNKVPDIDSSQSGFYQDSRFLGKLALGAIELYKTTHNKSYLDDATIYGDSAGSDYWWSWGNINSLADYNIAKYIPRFGKYILNNLLAFNAYKNKSVFKEGMAFTWGTTNSFLGVALQEILHKRLTRKNDFDSLAVYERDYVLGRNPWGISFIYNIGSVFPKHLHSQIAYFNNGYLPGALTAGPAPENVLKDYDIKRTNYQYNYFNTPDIKYYDDMNDYITNEPTIGCNATAIFVFGFYSNRKATR